MFELAQGKSEEETLWSNFEIEAMPHMPDLFRVAMFLKRNRDLAEELVQETMMQGLKSFHRYKLGTNCKAWLTTIMYNTHYKQIRKLTKLKLVEDTEEIIAQTVPFEPSIPQQVTDEDVLKAIDNVPDTFREIVVLCDVEGFSYKEIASIMDIPMGTVMSRLHRGRKILRGELAVFAREYGLDVDGEKKEEKVKRKGGESV
ncbi:MAG: sigma-70 family RNA polymerase sigma factor [Pyrinomonadaceae bacterium]|nr:sigma-70 family RNA polymerase sigma factor [Pyrinomonadaceae bacterium]